MVLSQSRGVEFSGKVYIADSYTKDMSVTSSQVAPSEFRSRVGKSNRPLNEALQSPKAPSVQKRDFYQTNP